MWSVADWVSIQLRREALLRHVPRGANVLEFRAGAGHFTEVLHQLGCGISVADPSLAELRSTRAYAVARGFESSIQAWYHTDILALDGVADAAHDAVVAYGGALSHASQQRHEALAECRRVLRPAGVLAIDVLSLWGTLHRHLSRIVGRDIAYSRSVIRSGDVVAGGRELHLFRAAELRAFLSQAGFKIISLFASSVLSTGREVPRWPDAGAWRELLEYERAACVERGCLESGTRLVAVAHRY